MRLITIPDFAGDNAAHTIAQIMTLEAVPVPVPPLARGILIHEASAGTTSSRVGDQTVAATRGMLLSLNDTLILPQLGSALYSDSPMWDLNQVSLYTATGDVISITLML
jgi:hypothetical protein